MAKIKIEINTDNDDLNYSGEWTNEISYNCFGVGNVLLGLAQDIKRGKFQKDQHKLYDINGNVCGFIKIEEK